MSIPDLKKTFSDNLRRIRGGRTQGEMAELLGVPQPMYARWEKGGGVPRADRLKKIASKLGVSETDLLSTSGKSESKEDVLEIIHCSNSQKVMIAKLAKEAGESIPSFLRECLTRFSKATRDELVAESASVSIVKAGVEDSQSGSISE